MRSTSTPASSTPSAASAAVGRPRRRPRCARSRTRAPSVGLVLQRRRAQLDGHVTRRAPRGRRRRRPRRSTSRPSTTGRPARRSSSLASCSGSQRRAIARRSAGLPRRPGRAGIRAQPIGIGSGGIESARHRRARSAGPATAGIPASMNAERGGLVEQLGQRRGRPSPVSRTPRRPAGFPLGPPPRSAPRPSRPPGRRRPARGPSAGSSPTATTMSRSRSTSPQISAV